MAFFSFKLICAFTILALLAGFIRFLEHWVKSGEFKFSYFSKTLHRLFLFSAMFFISALSIPLGEFYNEKDVKNARNYIDNIKKKVDKYYYENGEYPKFIEQFLPEGESPKLLERHEFFTYGVRGTYYFSRAEKYCFLFQNPNRDFGYYSLTSERDWRFSRNSDSYDNVFINLCDESMKSYESLISQHLGLGSDEDKLVDEATAAANASLPRKMSNQASQKLQEKILEESKNQPELKKYFNLPKNATEKKK